MIMHILAFGKCVLPVQTLHISLNIIELCKVYEVIESFAEGGMILINN
jgi:hypothetical protein